MPGTGRFVQRRAVHARSERPLPPLAGLARELFRDPPEKLSAKLYESELRKPAQMGAQPLSRGWGEVGPPGGLVGHRWAGGSRGSRHW